MDSKSTSRSRLSFDRLYLLGEDLRSNAFRVRTEAVLDPYGLVRAEYRPTQPIIFRQHLGSVIGDIVGTSYGVVFLVSDRFIETLKTNGFRGWVTFPVVVLNNAQEEITGYHGFAVKGRSGPIDRSRGERVIVPPPSPQGGAVAAVRGVFPDETEWDGSDIFVPAAEREKRPVYVFVLDSVKKAIDAAGLTNVNFQRATEVEEMIV